jgi:type I restriction enzyme R subunit
MTEDQLEQEALGWLAETGYATRYGLDIAPEGPDYGDEDPNSEYYS